MRKNSFFLIPVLFTFGCAGSLSVLGMPTVVSDTAFDIAPEITNPAEVHNAMREDYPPLLRDAGIRGAVVLFCAVDETGKVQRASLEQSSGHQALDDMALELAMIMQFSPAQNGGEAVPVTVTVPINLVPPAPQRATRRVGG